MGSKIFTERLRLLRAKAGLTQQQLAKALGISRGALSFYENGDRKPDAGVICRMSEYFEVPADYILGLSSVDSYDIDLQSVCDYTGLSAEAIENIVKHTNEENREVLNKLLSCSYFWEIVFYYVTIKKMKENPCQQQEAENGR